MIEIQISIKIQGQGTPKGYTNNNKQISDYFKSI
jgi:hypothetical protein